MIIQESFEIENGILKAYAGKDTIVTIPEGVHTINDGAFKGETSIVKVNLPETLRKIESTAFKGCRMLREVSFNNGLTEIGEFAFHRCHSLKEVVLPKSMNKVGKCAFLYCDGLKKVVMEGPEHFEKGTFSHDLSLEEIVLNENVDDANFNDEVFEGCVKLRKITLSGEIYEINNLIEAMNKSADYPKVIKSIARGVFHSMQIEDGMLMSFSINLKTITIPEGITSIGKSCFFDKKGIINIIFPESLREIKANAFANCLSLEEVSFQSEDLVLDEKAFRGCCNLKRVNLLGETYNLEEENSHKLIGKIREQVLGDFYISGKILVRYMGNEEKIKIPKEVEIIGERCFYGNEQLKTVVCPEGLLEIREEAFSGCVTLQNVELSDKLRRVEREAFSECKKLLKCNLPDTLEYIGEYAFRRCFMLKPFEPWPEKAVIEPYAFYKAKNFVNKEENLSKLSSYDYIEGDDRVIKPYAYTRHEDIKVLNLTNISRIGKYAFSACPNLEEVKIDAPECVLEQNVFSSCPNLKRVYINVKELGKGTFSGCYLLEKFEAKGVTKISERCFDECINLSEFDLSDIQSIGERAFERCDALKCIDLSNIKCGYHAFSDCASLEKIEISEKTILGSNVFTGCTQVKQVVVHADKENEYTFNKFSDSLNHVNNPYPVLVREVIASIYSCFDIREKKMLMGYYQDATQITIPEDIIEVGQDVFRDHIRLSVINIPETIRNFGSHAFTMTRWLEKKREESDMVVVNGILIDGAGVKGKAVIPPYVNRVASWSFAGNTDITELMIPSGNIIIESLSFRNCLNLKKITDWNQNEYILRNVDDIINADYPELIKRIFSECINCFKLDETKTLVESTGNITDITFPIGIKGIGEGVYKDCHLLENIKLSDDTEIIGKSAFESSKWLKMVTNAKNVASVGMMAFSGCQSLENIDLSDNLKSLGKRCFEHCSSLKEIYISEQVEVIPERTFFRCKSLTKLYIPKSVKVIESNAFAFCENLKEVQISENTKVSDDAFAFCDKLEIIIRKD